MTGLTRKDANMIPGATMPAGGAAGANYRSIIERARTTGEENLWLITMTDVMSLLLVCFIMFFVMTKHKDRQAGSTTPQQKVSESTKPVQESTPARKEEKAAIDNTAKMKEQAALLAQLEQIRTELDSFIQGLNKQEGVKAKVINQDVIITIQEQVTFQTGNADLLPDSLSLLDQIAGAIKEHSTLKVEVTGHTDNIPIHTPAYPSNWELSTARAVKVVKYFIARHGIDPARFSVKGNADLNPVAPNDTLENRAKNRRVEIKLQPLPPS